MMVGQEISYYRIIEKLGSGGMGMVFLAEDTKLNRKVALKFLPSEYTTDVDIISRFKREAQALAALNHPNIITVHEVGEHDGIAYIAMEYVKGKSLRDAILKEEFTIAEVLEITIQICEGLNKAHKAGVFHRDIKPENILIDEDGLVKIVDFGLAKLEGASKLTKQSSTLGTLHYLAPEQFQGLKLDHRTDIWSLGVVLYEMITGHLPFQGDFEAAVIYTIMNEDPKPLAIYNIRVSKNLQRIIEKTLIKDVSSRYQTVNDILTDLKNSRKDTDLNRDVTFSATGIATRLLSRISTRKFLFIFVFSLILIAASISYNILNRGMDTSRLNTDMTLTQFTSSDGIAVFPCWSPDGNWIVYASDEAGNMDIWKKPVKGGKASQLTKTPYNESQPDWSPDGRTIAFSSNQDGGGIFLIPSVGGTPWHLTKFGANPKWSPDSKTLAFERYGNIYLVARTGREPQLLATGSSANAYIAWGPKGKMVAFWNRTKKDIYVISIEDKDTKALNLITSGNKVSGLTWSKDGKELVFSRGPWGGNKDLWKVAMDPNTGKSIGSPSLLSLSITKDVQCRFSPDGTKIVFAIRQIQRNLWACSIDSATGTLGGEPSQITFASKNDYYPALSRDGRSLVWTSHESDHGHLHFKHLNERRGKKVTEELSRSVREIGGSFSPDGKHISYASTLGGSYQIWRIPIGNVGVQLTETVDPRIDSHTAWSPDGKTIAFYSNRSGNWDIWTVQAIGGIKPKRLTNWESNELYQNWSPDGRYLSFMTDKDGNSNIWLMDSDGGNPHIYIDHPAQDGWSAWSPNGRWFYFASNRSGVFNIWVKSIEGGEVRQVTSYKGLDFGLPEIDLYTRFAVSDSILIVPLEARKADIYLLENIQSK